MKKYAEIFLNINEINLVKYLPTEASSQAKIQTRMMIWCKSYLRQRSKIAVME